ncbi:5' nucleotidase, NT5C type [Natronospora cellulosivora (SeqCode)]
MKKTIGIDIDGVITDEIHPNKNIWHDALCTYLGYDIKMVNNSYYFDKAYNLPLKQINSFIEEKIEDIYKEVRISNGAKETINQFYDQGFDIHLITARDKKHQQITKNWVDKNQIKYTSISHEEDKAPLASKKEINIFIEDHVKNAQELSEIGIKVLLVNKYHNADFIENKNMITRVNNWTEIREKLKKHFKL